MFKQLIALLFACSAYALPVTLEWNPNPESNLAGYRLYWGSASGRYDDKLNLPPTTSRVTVSDFAGPTYFALTAVNSAGLESEFSNEAVFDGVPVIVELAGQTWEIPHAFTMQSKVSLTRAGLLTVTVGPDVFSVRVPMDKEREIFRAQVSPKPPTVR